MADSEASMQLTQDVLDIMPEDDPERPKYLIDLALSLKIRYVRIGTTSDIEDAVRIAREGLQITPYNHPDRPSHLSFLGSLLNRKHLGSGSLKDLEEAIQIAREAVAMTPKDQYACRASRLNNLGESLHNRFLSSDTLDELDESIQIGREVLDIASGDDCDRCCFFNNLGVRLSDRHQRLGYPLDLEEAINLKRKAVDLAPKGDALLLAKFLINLGNSLSFKFLEQGDPTYLEQAISHGRKAVGVVPKLNPARMVILDNLGNYLDYRFLRLGKFADLEESIQLGQEVIDIVPDRDPGRPGFMNNLGNRFAHRYTRSGALSDIENAIILTRRAIELTPESHPSRTMRLNNLGKNLTDRYHRMGTLPDLEEAVKIGRTIVDTPLDHRDRPMYLNHLGVSLFNQYERTKDKSHLEEATLVARQVVRLTPIGNADRPGHMNNLGVRLHRMYLDAEDLDALQDSVEIGRTVIDLLPRDHSQRTGYLNNLADRLNSRYKETHNAADIKEAILCARYAMNDSSSAIIDRIKAVLKIIEYCSKVSDWQEAFEASKTASELIPKLISRSLNHADKQHMLGLLEGLASDMAAAALHAGQEPSVAVKFLEQGRGVLATYLEETRADVSELRTKDPELAEMFFSLQEELAQSTLPDLPVTNKSDSRPWQAQLHTKAQKEDEFDKLIVRIRHYPGFRDFLLPPSASDAQAAAADGPIVVINVSWYRCDALLITQYQIRSIPLPQISRMKVHTMGHQDLGSLAILRWLWEVIAGPVLKALGYTHAATGDTWPHIWWIPTGPLSKFPLHAAGYHHDGSSDTVIDRVVSSYSSSVKTIINGRRHKNPQINASCPAQALLVAMRYTPGQSGLLFASRELEMLRNLLHPTTFNIIEMAGRKQNIVHHLPSCRLFHFAGHGFTGKDPLQSHLVLQNEEHLTVSNLLDMNLRQTSPFLAYLSACGTGQIEDEKFFDEGIHLVSAYQLAGFRHVIGTLWEVNDRLCADIAKVTYEEILDGGMTDISVARGLHNAVRKARAQWLNNNKRASTKQIDAAVSSMSNEVESDNIGNGKTLRKTTFREINEGSGPVYWVPYVHFGV